MTGSKGKTIESLHAELGKVGDLHCLLFQIGFLARLSSGHILFDTAQEGHNPSVVWVLHLEHNTLSMGC